MNMKTQRINERARSFYDDVGVTEGPGLTRAMDGEQTREFELLVKQQGSEPMKVMMRAATKAKARQYLLARWPSAEVQVL